MVTTRALLVFTAAAAALAVATGATAQVAQCRQAQPTVSALIDAAMRRVDAARQTNDPAALRDAADDLQAALLDVRAHLAPCAAIEDEASADSHAGHAATPPQTPAPAAVPPAKPAGAADPHAGHGTPAAPSPAPAPRGGAADPPRSPQSRPAAPPADPHAGHAAPAAPAPADSGSTGTAGAATSGLPAPATTIADLQCRAKVDPRRVPRMLYQGRMYYFCSEQERSAFASDPGRYATPPPESAPAHAH